MSCWLISREGSKGLFGGDLERNRGCAYLELRVVDEDGALRVDGGVVEVEDVDREAIEEDGDDVDGEGDKVIDVAEDVKLDHEDVVEDLVDEEGVVEGDEFDGDVVEE